MKTKQILLFFALILGLGFIALRPNGAILGKTKQADLKILEVENEEDEEDEEEEDEYEEESEYENEDEDDDDSYSLSDKLEIKRVQLMNKVTKRKQELAKKQKKIQAQITAKHAERLERRYGLYYEKLDKFIERIEERAEQMSQRGVNVTDVLAVTKEAKTKLEIAKLSADMAIDGFNSIEADELETSNDSALAAKDVAEKSRNMFREVYVLLLQAIRLLKNS